MSRGEETFAQQLGALKMTGWEREVPFAKPRRWRADFLHATKRIIVEIDGATWTGGRHSRGAGIQNDCDKRNHATALGYRVFRFTTDDVKSGRAIALIEHVLATA